MTVFASIFPPSKKGLITGLGPAGRAGVGLEEVQGIVSSPKKNSNLHPHKRRKARPLSQNASSRAGIYWARYHMRVSVLLAHLH